MSTDRVEEMHYGVLSSVDRGSADQRAGAYQHQPPKPGESTAPLVSICVVSYNGIEWLPGWYESVCHQDVADVEVLVVDGGSADGTADWMAQAAAGDERIRFLALGENIGYARGQNINIAAARADCVVLVNQDVELDRAYLVTVLSVLAARQEIGSVQGLVGRLDVGGERVRTIDTTGLVIARDRRVTSRDQGEPSGAVERAAGPIWGVDGPVAAYRRAALDDARLPSSSNGSEVLDEDFFMYKEDVDLAWRLHGLGWAAWYEPAAQAWHGRSAGGPAGTGWRDIIARNRVTPAWIRALSWRNQRLMQLKNDDPADFLRDLPWIARREVLAAAYVVVADPGRLAVWPSLARLIPAALRKRRALRASRAHRRLAQRAHRVDR